MMTVLHSVCTKAGPMVVVIAREGEALPTSFEISADQPVPVPDGDVHAVPGKAPPKSSLKSVVGPDPEPPEPPVPPVEPLLGGGLPLSFLFPQAGTSAKTS